MKQGSQLAMGVLVALGISAGVTACGGGGGGGGSGSSDTNGQATHGLSQPAQSAAQPAAAAPSGPVTTPAAPAQKQWTGTMIPLYTVPSDPSWTEVINAHTAHPSIPTLAVINPGNGPGAAVLTSYSAGIARLRAAGVKVIGDTHTSYGERPAADVQADMNSWRSLYPDVTGVFFDEMAKAPGKEDYYRGLTAYAKQHGFDFAIGNPGDDTVASYVGTVDLILIYENSGLPSQASLGGWHSSYERHNFGIIPYGVPAEDAAFVAAAKQNVGYIYLSSDSLPNPWDTVPGYLERLLANIESS